MSWRLHNRAITNCPQCGNPQALIVKGGLSIDADKRDAESGQFVFVDCSIAGLPDQVCLACYPKWSTVNQIALHLFDWQMAKEREIAFQEFTSAAAYRDRQDSLRRLLRELVSQIISEGKGSG